MQESAPDRGWPEILSRLDRHTAGLPTSDTADLHQLMETYRIPGISIAVGRLDGYTWAAGYGTTGAGGTSRVNGRTVFQACSISKHVTAFGALRLVADGVLGMDTDIDDYLVSWPLPASGQGWRPQVTLFSFAWPDRGTAVAVMANCEGTGEVLATLLAAAQRQCAPASGQPAAATPDDLVGHYLLRKDYPVQIAAGDGCLTFTAAGQRPVDLLPLPGGSYRIPGLDCEIMFRFTDGRTTVHVRQGDSTRTASRQTHDPA
jgi:Beta-lactamase